MRLVSDGARRVIEPKTPALVTQDVAIAAATEIVVTDTTLIVNPIVEMPVEAADPTVLSDPTDRSDVSPPPK